MKNFFYFVFFISSFVFAQSNTEIAEIYLIKSEEQLKKKELTKALVYFDKAKSLLGDKTTAKVEEIGTMIYYNLEDYKVAKEHAKQYFALTTEKGSDRYNEVLFLYVDIEEKIEAENKIKAELLAAEMLRKKEQARLDSLTGVWNKKAENQSIVADTIYPFDRNNVAVFKSANGFYGVIDDQGNTLVAPGNYSGFMHYDSRIVLTEGIENQATKIMTVDTYSQEQWLLPAARKFNALSTNYGKVMLPRENGLLVTYPNNSKKVLVYDINGRKFKETEGLDKYFQYWKDQKVIKKFNKENQIKIDKEYLDYGGDLGGYMAFYTETGDLFCYISLGGHIIKVSEYNYLGTLKNGILQAEKSDGQTVWLTEKGVVTDAMINKNGLYKGMTVLKKVKGNYQFVNPKNEIMKDGVVLESLESFLTKN